MKLTKSSLLVLFLFLGASLVHAQLTVTGSVHGTVVDQTNQPLPGVAVTVKGPALIGSISAITSTEGVFRIPSLPPGKDYEITAELSGFQTVKRGGLIVRSGVTLPLVLQMSPVGIDKEITVIAASPVIDTMQAKNVQSIAKEVINTLPLARTYISLSQIAPAVQGRLVHSGTNNDTGMMVDGVQSNAANQGYAEVFLPWDAMEEIEMVTGAVPAEAFNAIGGYMNVITKSGGNKFSGSAQAYFTNKHLASVLLPPEQIAALKIASPTFPIFDGEASGTLGGPIFKDKLWFFADFRYANRSYSNVFRPTVLMGKSYGTYDFPDTEYYEHLKITGQISESLRGGFTISLHQEPKLYNSQAWYATIEANQKNLGTDSVYALNLTHLLGKNDFVDWRFGYVYHESLMPYSTPGLENNPYYSDAYTSYVWGSGAINRIGQKTHIDGSVKWTHFQDDFLGGDHEFKMGVDIQYGGQLNDEWRANSLSNWVFYNGNPYYYRGLYNLSGPSPAYGDGLLTFTSAATKDMGSATFERKMMYGGFIQDSWTFKNRLTLNAGLRYDYIYGWMPSVASQGADSLAQAIGDAVFVPTYGFNPFAYNKYDGWDNPIPYKKLSPTISAVFDVFGDQKTALKIAYGQYGEQMPTTGFSDIYPVGTKSFQFYWWDQNNNGQPDLPGVDNYVSFGASPLAIASTFYKSRIGSDIKVPYANEFSATIEHEPLPDLKLSLGYVYQDRKNILEDVLYDYTTGRQWNHYEQAPEWWVPFNTTIPAYGAFPAQNVTVYFMSKNAPAQNTRLINVPDAKRVYQAVEFSFDKRMSHGWQLGGSVVIAALNGNFDYSASGTGIWSSRFNDPNWYINSSGSLPDIRPLQIKLYGTFSMPYGFMASFFFVHQSGTAWARTVTVAPPAAWAAANNAQSLTYSIWAEPRGTRVNPATDNLDVRIEKSIGVGSWGRLGFFVDVFNLLGFQMLNVGTNPGGTWKPSDAGTTDGTYTPGSQIVTGITSGTRIIKLSMRLSF